VAYSPLGRGFLADRFRKPEDLTADDWRRGNPRFQGENFQKNLDLADRLRAIAADKGALRHSWRSHGCSHGMTT